MTLRILCSFVGGRGHLEPLLPIARAARRAGHAVEFSCGPSMADAVTGAGFDVLPLPANEPPPADDGPPEPKPLLAVDRAREERDLREKFADDAARHRATRLLAQAPRWRPDVIVCDEGDFGAVIAAERLGIPCATVIVLAAGGMLRPDVVAETLDRVRADHGLPRDPELLAMRGGLVIDPTPAGYRDPADPLPDGVLRVRLTEAADAEGARPWQPVRPDGPALYVTLGTVFNLESGDLLSRVLAAVADHPGDVLVTTGAEIDPASLGPQPDHVHLERFVPQGDVLPHVAAVVSHAGSGSVLGALAQGLPMVLLPMGADQPWNGDRCTAIGVARVLDPVAVTAVDLGRAIDEVLADPASRAAAMRQRDALAALPGPDAAVAALDRLAGRQPD